MQNRIFSRGKFALAFSSLPWHFLPHSGKDCVVKIADIWKRMTISLILVLKMRCHLNHCLNSSDIFGYIVRMTFGHHNVITNQSPNLFALSEQSSSRHMLWSIIIVFKLKMQSRPKTFWQRNTDRMVMMAKDTICWNPIYYRDFERNCFVPLIFTSYFFHLLLLRLCSVLFYVLEAWACLRAYFILAAFAVRWAISGALFAFHTMSSNKNVFVIFMSTCMVTGDINN